MTLFMRQIAELGEVSSNSLQEVLCLLDSLCCFIDTDWYETGVIFLLTSIEDTMQVCRKIPGQETCMDKFPIKETDSALMFPRNAVMRLIVCNRANTL